MGPTIFGYVSLIGWRWSFGLDSIITGVTLGLILFLPETFAPRILLAEARRKRCSLSCKAVLAPAEQDTQPLFQILLTTISRLIYMFFTEAIVFFSCLYLSRLLDSVPLLPGICVYFPRPLSYVDQYRDFGVCPDGTWDTFFHARLHFV